MHWDSKWLLGSKRVSTLEMWAFQFVLFLIPCRHSLVSTLHHCSAHYRRAKNSTHCSCCLLLTSTPELQMGRSDCSDSIMFVIITKRLSIHAWKIQFLSLFLFPGLHKQISPVLTLQADVNICMLRTALNEFTSKMLCSDKWNVFLFLSQFGRRGENLNVQNASPLPPTHFLHLVNFYNEFAFGMRLKMATTKL